MKDQVAIPNKTVPDVETTKVSYFSTGAVQRGEGGAAPSKNYAPPVAPIKFMIKHLLGVVHCGIIGPCPPAAIMATPLAPQNVNPRTATASPGRRNYSVYQSFGQIHLAQTDARYRATCLVVQ